MSDAAKARAREQFAAIQKKKAEQALSDQEEALQKRMEHTARLRALRLAKEAADKEVAAATVTTN